MESRKISAWVTIKHHHIPIFEGESKQDVINRLKMGAKKGKETYPVSKKSYIKKRDAAEKAVNALESHIKRVAEADERLTSDKSESARKEKLNADRTLKEAEQRYKARNKEFKQIEKHPQMTSYKFTKKQMDKELQDKNDSIAKNQQVAQTLNNPPKNYDDYDKKINDTLIVQGPDGKMHIERYMGQNLDEYPHIAEVNHDQLATIKGNSGDKKWNDYVMNGISYSDIYDYLRKEFNFNDGKPTEIKVDKPKNNDLYFKTDWQEGTGPDSASFKNSLATGKRWMKRGYSWTELVEATASEYYLNPDEASVLNDKLKMYAIQHGDYKELHDDWKKDFEKRGISITGKQTKLEKEIAQMSKEPEYERTPKMDWIDKRISGKTNEIEKLEKKLERINKAKESNYKENNPYYYSDYDFNSTTKDLERAKKELEQYKQDMQSEIEKAKSRNVPVITEFLNDWEKKTVAYFQEEHEKYPLARAKHLEKMRAKEEALDKYRWDKEHFDRETYKKMDADYWDTDKAFKSYWHFITQFNDGQGTWEENMRRAVAKEKVAKYDDIITRTNSIVGQITDTSGLHIGKKLDLNGLIIGTKGKATVETIGAGGYNIQRYHFRTLINKLKEKK